MTDEQVGELWREFDGEHRTHFDYREHIRDLIRKLVEERKHRNQAEAWLRWFINGQEGPSPSMILPDDAEIVRDFHIDPATWKTE